MVPQAKMRQRSINGLRTIAALIFCGSILVFTSCSELEKPKPEVFYSETKPPRSQDFRWTNGQTPKTFDPAKASAPPETDFARALYDGLTDTEPKTLDAIPGVASDWSSTDDAKVWNFKLRRDAKWSNGKPVTAKDFVRSWKRLAEMDESVSHHGLLKNIVGMAREPKKIEKDIDVFSDNRRRLGTEYPKPTLVPIDRVPKVTSDTKATPDVSNEKAKVEISNKTSTQANLRVPRKDPNIGVEAIGDFELKVSLIEPDRDFPKLVAHPIFRPVYANGEEFENENLNPDIVTNGAFRISSVSEKGITIKRAEHYWDKKSIKLETVTFVPTKDAEGALQAYKEGRVDAVTNSQFEPLALKLLTPYFDFKRVTHSALNLYEFNRQKAPFNDRRVREALALAIEREKLTDDEMDGATKPAVTYLPFTPPQIKGKFEHDAVKAKELLETAGFKDGENFPTIKLVVNRNNVQQQIAQSVAAMWKKELNISTEIVVKELDEMEKAKREGDYDVLRRGVVFPTSDETANMLAIFKSVKIVKNGAAQNIKPQINSSGPKAEDVQNPTYDFNEADNRNSSSEKSSNEKSGDLVIDVGEEHYILTEEEALLEVPGIPLYFPTAYSLVKPYVRGFEINTLDAPSLKNVEIESNWQPSKHKNAS